MPYFNGETPPAERRKPMPDGARLALSIAIGLVLLVVLALGVENAGPGRLMTGTALVFFAIWFVMVLAWGRDANPRRRNRQLDERPPEV